MIMNGGQVLILEGNQIHWQLADHLHRDAKRRQMVTGSLTPLARRAPLRHDSGTILYYHMILTLASQNSQPLFHPTAQKLGEIPRTPSIWNTQSKITNDSRHDMCSVWSKHTDTSTVRIPGQFCCSYLFLRMKLLLENLKLCWGIHDMLLPMLPLFVELCAALKTNCSPSVMDECNPRVRCAPCWSQTCTEGEVRRVRAL